MKMTTSGARERALLASLESWLLRNYGPILREPFGPATPFHRLRKKWRNRFHLRNDLLPWIREETGISEFYADELRANTRPAGLVRLLNHKQSQTPPSPTPKALTPTLINVTDPIPHPTIFILGCSRSGTTLLRSMLMGHPDVWAGPELQLLQFESMRSRERLLIDTPQIGMVIGLTQNIAAMKNWSIMRALQFVSRVTSRDASILEVYALLHKSNPKTLLVDKSPSLVASLNTLTRAESLFKTPYYIYITRHPMATVESLMRMSSTTFESCPTSAIAQTRWLRDNKNAIHHLDSIPRDRKRKIRFEDLVRDPKNVLTDICEMLQISYFPEMANPYEGQRLIEGIGCPNLPKRTQVDPSLADDWRRIAQGIELDEEVLHLANLLGY